MIGTGKHLRVALFDCADGRSPVCTAIEQDRDVAILASHQEDWLSPDQAGQKISGLGNLALMADKHPTSAEDFVELFLENA